MPPPQSAAAGGIADIVAGRVDLGISARDLWVGYFSLGGNGTQAEVDDWLSGAVPLPAREHNLLAQTLNDRYTDIGRNHPVPYSDGLSD